MKKLLIRVTLMTVTLAGLFNFTARAQNFIWLLNGNSGTSADVNFLGTLDNQALVLRTNNTERMRFLASGNTGIGTTNPLQKLDVNGNINIGPGSSLFMENNRVLKVEAANGNVFLGNGVASQNTGYYNTASGTYAFTLNTTGSYNTATGYGALYSNGIGSYNSAHGWGALTYNTTGSYNTATGYSSLYSNTSGYGNAANGYGALYYNTGGLYNTAMGSYAMYRNSFGNYNTAIGTDALYNNVNSYYNCAVGYLALAYSIDPGWNNTAVGSFAGPADNLYNTVCLGEEAYASASNQARIGNRSTTSIGGYANWTNISDGRVKKNISTNVPGLSFVNKLKPVTYNLDLDAVDKINKRPARKDKDGKLVPEFPGEAAARNAKQEIVYTGFVAQDVESAAKELNYDFSGVDAPKNEQDLYGLRYAEFVVPLVKAVQELSEQNDELRSRIEKLEALVLKNSPDAVAPAGIRSNGSSLEQNAPNPFANNTTIHYTLPRKFSAAYIAITDNSGKTVKQVPVSGSGREMITIAASTLASGTYQYSLIVDGRQVDSKQMILIK
jgi:trimeric autotransporter adhesin